jgi:hypothetical protein
LCLKIEYNRSTNNSLDVKAVISCMLEHLCCFETTRCDGVEWLLCPHDISDMEW